MRIARKAVISTFHSTLRRMGRICPLSSSRAVALLAVALVSALCAATVPLAVVKPEVSDRDGGAATPSSYVHDPGETMFFSFQVEGYAASSQDRVHLSYKVEARDPKGMLLAEPVSAEVEETLAPE